MRSVQKLYSHVLWKLETFTEEDTRYRKHRTISLWNIGHSLSPLRSRHLGMSQFSQLLSVTPSYFPESHWWYEISSLLKVMLVLGKARSYRVPNLGCRGLNHLGDLIFHQKFCTRCDSWVGTLSWWSCQSPVAHSFSLLKHPSSFHGGVFKLNVKFDPDWLLYSLRHFECNSHTVHMFIQSLLPPPLISTVKSSLFTHVHSSPLSLATSFHWCRANRSHYINNGWIFSGQPHVLSLYVCNNIC